MRLIDIPDKPRGPPHDRRVGNCCSITDWNLEDWLNAIGAHVIDHGQILGRARGIIEISVDAFAAVTHQLDAARLHLSSRHTSAALELAARGVGRPAEQLLEIAPIGVGSDLYWQPSVLAEKQRRDWRANPSSRSGG